MGPSSFVDECDALLLDNIDMTVEKGYDIALDKE